jgi:hypothetical protein
MLTRSTSWDSLVGIVVGYRLDSQESGFDSQQGHMTEGFIREELINATTYFFSKANYRNLLLQT